MAAQQLQCVRDMVTNNLSCWGNIKKEQQKLLQKSLQKIKASLSVLKYLIIEVGQKLHKKVSKHYLKYNENSTSPASNRLIIFLCFVQDKKISKISYVNPTILLAFWQRFLHISKKKSQFFICRKYLLWKAPVVSW